MNIMEYSKQLTFNNYDFSDLQDINLKDSAKEYITLMQLYSAGIMEIKTKLEILNQEFQVKFAYNPIHQIESRLKSPKSIMEKLRRKNLTPTVEAIKNNISDVAGIRVICNYIDDVEKIAALITSQDDIKLKYTHDYIKFPKDNGYRSLHIGVIIPVFLAESTVPVDVEIQIRTIAMDFWASLEHRMRYKSTTEVSEALRYKLKICADAIAEVDEEMQYIYKELQKISIEDELE